MTEIGRSNRNPAGRKALSTHPLAVLTLVRVHEFLREPEMIFWVFIFPVLLTTALGIAFRDDHTPKIPVAVETGDSEAGAHGASFVVEALKHSGEVTPLPMSTSEAATALRVGKVALVIRASGEPAAQDGGADGAQSPSEPAARPVAFDYSFDPTRAESRVARIAADDTLQRALGRGEAASTTERKVTEAGARYVDFLIPGLLGMNLMGSGMWGVGFSVVVARVRKLMRRLAVTPMRRSHYLLSFILSRMIFLVLEVTAILLFARFVFGYQVRGSLLWTALLLVAGALTFSGIGLLAAARPQTVEALSGLMNLFMVPMWLLSGTFFSSGRFPDFLQPFIKVLPLTAVNDSLRAVMNEGASLGGVWPAVCVMAAWSLISFTLALKIFRWQ